MVFSSLIFLYAFFPLSLLTYALCRTPRGKNRALLIFSLIFYGWGEPKYLFLLMFMALSSWICALGVSRAEPGRKKLWVAAAAVIDLGLIGFFKYAKLLCGIFGPVPEFIRNIVLPIGISFYTFQLLSYVVDVYRGEATAQKSYWNVLLYAALYHQCIAGPIVRYKTIDQELFSPVCRTGQWPEGISRFCTGLAKKALLANPCGALADSLILPVETLSNAAAFSSNVSALEKTSVLGGWIGILAYGLHIYLDFSAYSDMAIGMGLMLGLHYPENFNYPYISRSVTEFWRRWHISLGTFFRDYVYIPLGGNRGSRLRVMANTLAVWALTGLWHGASWNYVLWGLWFFLLLMLERRFLKKPLEKLPVLSNLYLLTVVALGWVIFRYTDLRLGWVLIKSLFGANGNALVGFAAEIQLKDNLFLLAVSVLAASSLPHLLCRKLSGLLSGGVPGSVWNALYYCVIPIALLLLSTACLVGDSYNPFIYFQF